jgi:hypothetical protein
VLKSWYVISLGSSQPESDIPAGKSRTPPKTTWAITPKRWKSSMTPTPFRFGISWSSSSRSTIQPRSTAKATRWSWRPFGHLLHERGTEAHRSRHHRGHRCIWSVARKGRYRGNRGGAILGGGGGRPGLRAETSRRGHVPLRSPRLEAPSTTVSVCLGIRSFTIFRATSRRPDRPVEAKGLEPSNLLAARPFSVVRAGAVWRVSAGEGGSAADLSVGPPVGMREFSAGERDRELM